MRIFFLFLLTSLVSFSETFDLYIACRGKGDGEAGIFSATLNSETGTISKPALKAPLVYAGFLDLTPDGKRLLATCAIDVKNKKNAGMALFDIANNGELKQTGIVSASGRGACHVNFDATGKVALVANYGSGNIASALVQNDGSLIAASQYDHKGSGPNKRRQQAPHAHSIYAGPKNQYAYSADLGTDSIFIYKIDHETAQLSPAGEARTPAGAGPRHLKFSNDGKFTYVLNELNTSVSVFEVLTKGQLKRIQDISTLPNQEDRLGMSCSEIVTHSNSKYVFTANRDTKPLGRDSITSFEILSDGNLKHISTTPISVSIPRNISLSPDGKWLVVSAKKSEVLVAMKVDLETGKLQSHSTIACPSPMCVVWK